MSQTNKNRASGDDEDDDTNNPRFGGITSSTLRFGRGGLFTIFIIHDRGGVGAVLWCRFVQVCALLVRKSPYIYVGTST